MTASERKTRRLPSSASVSNEGLLGVKPSHGFISIFSWAFPFCRIELHGAVLSNPDKSHQDHRPLSFLQSLQFVSGRIPLEVFPDPIQERTLVLPLPWGSWGSRKHQVLKDP